jgi:hypothetical protein
MADVIPLRRIARAMNDARAIGTPEDEWRRLRNEVQFYRSHHDRVEREKDALFRRGFWSGTVVGCVAGMWISVALAWVWEALA